MFTSYVRESTDRIVPIHCISKNAVEILLEYMLEYMEKSIWLLRMFKTFFAANFLEMLEVIDMCLDHISKAVESQTAWMSSFWPRITTVKN